MPKRIFRIDDFIGQRKAVEPILREQDGALARGESLPHAIFSGLSGSGKSLFAETLAARAHTAVRKFVGAVRIERFFQDLRDLNDGDFVFFDEAHGLSIDCQEFLFQAIDGPTLHRGEESIQLSSITLIFATDRPGKLLNALLKRIPTAVHFQQYHEEELCEIVALVAQRRGLIISPQAGRLLAQVSGGLPRRVEHHVAKLRLYFMSSEQEQLAVGHVREYLRANGYDTFGLSELERRLIRFLYEHGSASLDTLAAYIGLDSDYTRTQIEAPLRHRGLVSINSSGRVLTTKGKDLANQLR